MMWACLAGKHEMAKLIWAKTESPLRAALMAAQVCRRLSMDDTLKVRTSRQRAAHPQRHPRLHLRV
jgi:hypothetical protein